jgi:two-component system cell cycle response regulator PopA
MAISARLLLVGGSKALRLFAEDLLKAGHPAYRAETAAQAVDAARAECPHIVLVERGLLGDGDAEAFASAITDACRPFPPVMVVVSPEAIDKERRTELESVVDEVIVGPLDAATALFRLEPLTRLVTMRNELTLRRLTVSRFDAQPDSDVAPPADAPVLILASDPKQAAALGRAADIIGAHTVFSDDAFQAERILAGEECGALVAIADRESRDGVLSLCHQLRKNARLFHLPVLLLADTELANAPIDAYAQGANLVVPIGIAPEALAAEIASHLQRQRRRRALRDRLIAAIPASLLDSTTGLVAESFLMKHLATLIDAHGPRRRPLSLVVFAIRNLDAATAQHGADAAKQLHGEVARWIQRLVRAEDTAARLSSDEFVVLLPNTDDADARSLMYRIDDVLTHTQFGIAGEPFSLWIAEGRATARPHENASAVLSNARAAVGEPQS